MPVRDLTEGVGAMLQWSSGMILALGSDERLQEVPRSIRGWSLFLVFTCSVFFGGLSCRIVRRLALEAGDVTTESKYEIVRAQLLRLQSPHFLKRTAMASVGTFESIYE